ncbi:MAG TPA: adenosine deaminase, partial [Clostridiales bacterium]|nr:adenosine deaminase [Clostridiales bacterium]
MNIEWLKSSAKLDLHCHLDGSMSAETIEVLLKDES